VHPTGGSLRVFKRFAWLGVGSGKMAFLHPAHPRVTRAVRCNKEKGDIMKNRYLYFFILSFILFNCDSPIESHSYLTEFFPLKVGNKWYYKSNISQDTSYFNETIEVVAQKKINDNTYFETVRNIISSNIKDTLYYRLNEDVLYAMKPPQEESIIADFSLKLNEIAYWDSTGKLRVSERTDSTIVFSTPFGGDYGLSITYKKGIGITYEYINGYIPHIRELVYWELK